MTQQGAERAVPATGHLMAPKAERDNEVSFKGLDGGQALATAKSSPSSLSHCSILKLNPATDNLSLLQHQPWPLVACFSLITHLQDKHDV